MFLDCLFLQFFKAWRSAMDIEDCLIRRKGLLFLWFDIDGTRLSCYNFMRITMAKLSRLRFRPTADLGLF